MKSSLVGVLAGLALLFVGCISYPRQAFKTPSQSPIAQIAVVSILQPEQIRVIDRDGTGNAFGLIGAAVESSVEAQRTEGLKQRAGDIRALVAEDLSHAVESELKKQGYAVSIADQQPETVDAADFAYDYSTIATPADAVLHVWFLDVLEGGSVSYVWDQTSKAFRPNVVVCARLVNRKDNSQLYFQAFVYGRNYQVENIEYLPFSERYAFSDYDTLVSKSELASEGLRQAVTEIGSRIAAELAAH
jgi:hypothetical protein